MAQVAHTGSIKKVLQSTKRYLCIDGCRIVLPKMYGQFCIVLPKMHEMFRVVQPYVSS